MAYLVCFPAFALELTRPFHTLLLIFPVTDFDVCFPTDSPCYTHTRYYVIGNEQNYVTAVGGHLVSLVTQVGENLPKARESLIGSPLQATAGPHRQKGLRVH